MYSRLVFECHDTLPAAGRCLMAVRPETCWIDSATRKVTLGSLLRTIAKRNMADADAGSGDLQCTVYVHLAS